MYAKMAFVSYIKHSGMFLEEGMDTMIFRARRFFAATATALLLASLGNTASAAKPDPWEVINTDVEIYFSKGLEKYHSGDYKGALRDLELAAANGETEAAELVGQMYLAGEKLYGNAVPSDLKQARRWLHVASVKGSRTAPLPLKAIDRLRGQ